MRFKVIMDDEKNQPEYATGWGISVYFPDPHLLFDTGENYFSLEQNLAVSGIEKDDIRYIFIANEGWEHMGGLEAVLGVDKIVYVPSGVSDDLTMMIRSVGSECRMIDRTTEILPSIYAVLNPDKSNLVQSLLMRSAFGISIFVGSIQLGIFDTINATSRFEQPFDLIFGRLNSLTLNRRELTNLAKGLDKFNPKRIAPAHCSGDIALQVFREYFKERFINVEIGLEGEV
ncbi:hypothetical protein KAW48_03455 [candidate division WOR-3 bacterium]|nr:hypothetical protein [candidate division WOR-3 bacterium]